MTLPTPSTPTRIHSEFSFVIVAPMLAAPNENNEPDWATNGVLLNSITDVNGGSSSGNDEWYSIGSEAQVETEKIDEEVSITMIRPHNQTELVALLGYTTAPQNTKLVIQPDTKLWINIQHFIAAGDGTMVGDEVWQHVQWNDLQMTQSADGHAQYVFSGIAKRIYEKYTPAP